MKTLGHVIVTMEARLASNRTVGLRIRKDGNAIGISFFESQNSVYTEDDTPSRYSTSEVVKRLEKMMARRRFEQGKIESAYVRAIFENKEDWLYSVRETVKKINTAVAWRGIP